MAAPILEKLSFKQRTPSSEGVTHVVVMDTQNGSQFRAFCASLGCDDGFNNTG